MPSETIQWFPGHMAKTRRMIKEMLPETDFIIELCDARIPRSSENPEIKSIANNKPRLRLFTKSDLADPVKTAIWKKYFDGNGEAAIFINTADQKCVNEIRRAVDVLMAEKLERYKAKGMEGRTLRAMIVGIPNVGKSSLINRLAGSKRARVEDKPGVTRDKQWISASIGLELLDTPGVLWPKFDDQTVGENLAVTGAIRDEILDGERMSYILCSKLNKLYPNLLEERYKIKIPEGISEYDLFEMIARKRGFIISGGEINTERTSVMLLDEFRGGRIGRITLEVPEC